jgi:hypothetical protein
MQSHAYGFEIVEDSSKLRNSHCIFICFLFNDFFTGTNVYIKINLEAIAELSFYYDC